MLLWLLLVVASAVALLRQVQEPGYREQLTALEISGGYTPSSRASAGAGAGGRQPQGSRKYQAVPATIISAAHTTSTTAGSYYDQVRDLLAPLGTDSAITATLQTDSTLRNRMWQIANDTTTWGYAAGQAVLSQYLGYTFRPWYEGGGVLSGPSQRTTLATAADQPKGARLALYPNPADQFVTLQVSERDGRPMGVVRLVDALGRLCRTVALPADGTATLDLRGLAPGLYYYTYSVGVGEAPVQSGTLVKLP
ncbi:MAG: T9SS type A sorting domain-containing protein [Hymenobacteraceae bacterium]|nr:T9SS type A sorting domain-containing protein [Hymenobacteraceae bacterium]